MNLAVRDLRQHWGRFAFLPWGWAAADAGVLVQRHLQRVHRRCPGADPQAGPICGWCSATRAGRLPSCRGCRMTCVTGSPSCRACATSPYIFYTVQRPWQGRLLRFVVVGYDLGTGMGGPTQLVAGRGIAQAHYEMVADQSSAGTWVTWSIGTARLHRGRADARHGRLGRRSRGVLLVSGR